MLTNFVTPPAGPPTKVGTDPGPELAGRRGWAAAAAVVGVALVLAEAALKLGSCQDDAYVFLRYADNAARGLGLVFNPGERVEGFTSPLWELILAAVAAAGLDPLRAAGILGTLATVGTVLVSVRDARRCGLPGPFAVVAPVALAAYAHLVVWSVSGLETSLFTFLLWGGIAGYRGAVHEGRAPGASTGAWLAAATLARPEGALAVVVLAADAAVRAMRSGAPGAPQRRALTRAVASVAGAPLAFALVLVAARWAYYHDVLPNTFYAKAAGTWRHALVGLRYLGRFALATPLAWAAMALALPLPSPTSQEDPAGAASARRPPALAASVAFVALWAVHVARVGGDYLPYHRFLVPVAPLLFALGAAGVHRAYVFALARLRADDRHARHNRRAAAAALGVLALVAGLQHDPIQMQAQHGFQLVIGYAKLGRALGARLPPGATIAAPAIGAVGFHSRHPVEDLLGLVDRDLAHRPSRIRPDEIRTSDEIGHDHFDVDYSLARRPDVIVFARGYGSQPFADPSEVPCDLLVERYVLARIQERHEYVLRNLPVDEHAVWAVFVRADEADALGL